MKDEDGADTFFFLDPPYVKTGEKDKRGQGVGESAFDHAAFWKFLGTVKGKLLVTYDTPPPVKGFKVEKLTHRASSGRSKNDAYDTFVITNFGKTAAKKGAPVVKAPPEFENVVRLLPVEKAEEDKRIVFGVVLEPGEVDAQGDTISEDEIETAAHEWLAKYQNRGLMHRKLINAKIRIFESYISPADLTIGGQRVKKGTWLLMYHVLDDQIWQQIKSGKLRGFSMGGFARRVQMKAA
jgi:DNA adenine methylase